MVDKCLFTSSGSCWATVFGQMFPRAQYGSRQRLFHETHCLLRPALSLRFTIDASLTFDHSWSAMGRLVVEPVAAAAAEEESATMGPPWLSDR